MSDPTSSRPAGTLVGLGLIYGSAAGSIIGLTVAGGPGIAIGGAIGAGLGIVAGACLEQWASK